MHENLIPSPYVTFTTTMISIFDRFSVDVHNYINRGFWKRLEVFKNTLVWTGPKREFIYTVQYVTMLQRSYNNNERQRQMKIQ